MRAIILIVIIGSLFSCSHEKKLSRAKKHLANLIQEFPELVAHDTIFRMDTTVVNGAVHDTIFKTTITKDTLVIKDHQLTIKYYNDGKTTYLKGICDTVFIIKKVPEYINNINAIKEVNIVRWWDWMARAIALLAILFIIFDQISAKRAN